MIHFIVGKPRNGKSLLAMFKIWDTLVTTDKYIITNMVIDIDALQDLVLLRGECANVRSRIRMLNDVETKDFWLYREYGTTLPVPCDYEEKTGGDVDYTPIFDDERFYSSVTYSVVDGVTVENPRSLKGTLYVIDEVHTHWRARGWAGTPRHVDFYNSQHGKLNDTVYFITQNTKLVDQNFIRLAQDFTYCRNHRLEKHGVFKGDDKFTASTYPSPTSSSAEVTLNVETYKLDKKMAACYDTSAGVGMRGGGVADGGYRAKGVPLKMVWVALAVVLVLVFCFFQFVIPKLTRKYLGSSLGGASLVSSGNVAPEAASRAVVSRDSVGSYVVPPADTTPEKPLYVSGWVKRGGRYLLQLSNGDTIREGERLVVAMSSSRVVFSDGTILRVRAAPRGSVSDEGAQGQAGPGLAVVRSPDAVPGVP